MKGAEGVDYVITECSHCEGSGKCTCKGCRVKAWQELEKSTSLEDFLGLVEYDDCFICSACAGSGKIVFWREK